MLCIVCVLCTYMYVCTHAPHHPFAYTFYSDGGSNVIWHSGPIVEREGPYRVKTKSGSIYVLNGKINSQQTIERGVWGGGGCGCNDWYLNNKACLSPLVLALSVNVALVLFHVHFPFQEHLRAWCWSSRMGSLRTGSTCLKCTTAPIESEFV